MMKNMKKATLMGVALLGCLQVTAANANDYAKQYTQAYSAINDSIVANDKAAVAVLSDLAKKNYPQAVVAMGQVYSYGIDVPQNFAKAKEYYNQAIKLGCQGVDAALRDCNKRQGYASRIAQIREGAKKGDAKSYGELGWCYANGVVVDFSNDRAIECFNLGAEKNDALSMYELGVRHYIGYGVKRDVNKAVKLFEKAAQAGNVDAQYQMALIYDEATPLAKDNAKAVNWYDKAVAQNHDAALYNVALQYLTGSLRGVNKNKAIECLQKSSDLGNADAAYLLGYLYEQGTMVSADPNKALQLYQLSFSRGNCDAAVGAGRIWMFKLKNNVKAKEWFDKAAEKGVKQGEYYRYIMNNSTNIKALEKNAKDGNVEAAKVLSICYYEGLGVAKNDKNAFKFMKKAAEKDADANYQLAQYYINAAGNAEGIHVNKNTPIVNQQQSGSLKSHHPSKLTEAELQGSSKHDRTNIRERVDKDLGQAARNIEGSKPYVIDDAKFLEFMKQNYAQRSPGKGYARVQESTYTEHPTINDMKTFIDQLPDTEINPIFKTVKDPKGVEWETPILTKYRHYLSTEEGLPGDVLSTKDIQKLLTFYEDHLNTQVTGKLKEIPLWHNSKRSIDRFDLSHLGENTGNTGAYGPGNYFNANVEYGFSDHFSQPFYVTDINQLMKARDASDYKHLISPPNATIDQVFYPKNGRFATVQDYSLIDDPLVAYPIYKGEVAVPRNTGIKSLYPHSSRFVRQPDGTVTFTPTDWSDVRFNFKNGGKLLTKRK